MATQTCSNWSVYIPENKYTFCISEMVAMVRAESVWMWTSKTLLQAPWHSHVPTRVALSVASDHGAGFLPQDLCMRHFFLLRVLFLHSIVSIKSVRHGASLVAQWLRICLLMQGTRVRALVWEDPTCRRATRPVSHNC